MDFYHVIEQVMLLIHDFTIILYERYRCILAEVGPKHFIASYSSILTSAKACQSVLSQDVECSIIKCTLLYFTYASYLQHCAILTHALANADQKMARFQPRSH